jgi:hypothetical protein
MIATAALGSKPGTLIPSQSAPSQPCRVTLETTDGLQIVQPLGVPPCGESIYQPPPPPMAAMTNTPAATIHTAPSLQDVHPI